VIFQKRIQIFETYLFYVQARIWIIKLKHLCVLYCFNHLFISPQQHYTYMILPNSIRNDMKKTHELRYGIGDGLNYITIEWASSQVKLQARPYVYVCVCLSVTAWISCKYIFYYSIPEMRKYICDVGVHVQVVHFK
jgi:hypothetical protein